MSLFEAHLRHHVIGEQTQQINEAELEEFLQLLKRYS